MGPTSPTTPEPECDTFAIAPSGGGLTKRAVDGGDCPSGVPHFHLCLRHGAGKHFSGFEFFLLPKRIHAHPTATTPYGGATLTPAVRQRVVE